MNILGIDTCTDSINIGVINSDSRVFERRESSPRKHLTLLIPMISGILEEAGLTPSDLSAVAVTSGPGSFTGIRLGIATARTFAQILNIPVVSLNTLDVLARQTDGNGLIISSMDAKKSEIFYAVYERKTGDIHRLSGYERCDCAGYVNFLKNMKSKYQFPENSVPTITGNVFIRYAPWVEEALSGGYVKTSGEKWSPEGKTLALMGMESMKKGETIDFNCLTPIYMRCSDAVKPK